jgi:hypothetical protein
MFRIAPKQNVFKFKIVPHKQKSMATNFFFGRKMGPLANDAMHEHNGKSGTGDRGIAFFGGKTCSTLTLTSN